MNAAMHMIVLLLLFAVRVGAAQIYVEDFSGGTASATGSLSLGVGKWTFTGGVARVSMNETTPLAIPDTAVLRLTAGAFTGNYTQAGIEVVGFRFRTGTVEPSDLYLELTTGSGVFQRSLPVPPAGVSNLIMVPLEGVQPGGWRFKRGLTNDFSAALQDVKSIELKIRRAGVTAVDHTVDDFFVDGRPRSGGSMLVAGSAMSMSWGDLQPGGLYMMQQSPSLAGPWTDAAPMAATNRYQSVTLSLDASPTQLFFRLRGP